MCGRATGSPRGLPHWADPDAGFSADGVQADRETTGGTCVVNGTNDSEFYAFHTGGMTVTLAEALSPKP